MINHVKRFDEYYAKNNGQFWLDGVDDYWVCKAYNDRNKRICEIVNGMKSDSVLDIGCGTGDLALMLRRDKREVVGVEPSSVNRNKFIANTKCSCINSCAEYLWFSNNAFDVAIMADVIEHVVDAQKALQEALRVIKVGGHLILTTPNKFADLAWSIGSKRIFNKSQVKDSLFTASEFRELLVDAWIKFGNINWNYDVEGIYPRSKILSFAFHPNNIIMMRLLRWLEGFECLRYRQIVVVRKIK